MSIINDVLVDKLFPDKPKRTKEIPLLQQKSASGESIVIQDAYPDMQLKGLNLYGKSTQVTTTGAQLFDVDAGGMGWINSSTGEYETNNKNYVSGFIPVETGVNFSTNVVLSPYVYSYDKDKNFISKEGYGNSFTPQGNIAFIRFCISGDIETSRKIAETIMINKGRAKPYEPYTGGKPSPSIEYPQEITSVGDKGNINIQVKGNVEPVQNLLLHTPNGLPGIPVSTGGNYTDSTGRQWVCDEIDFERGRYVQRIAENVWDNVSFNDTAPNKFQNNVLGNYKFKNANAPSMSNFAIYSSWANNVGSFAANGSFFYYHSELEMTVEQLNELFNSKAPIKIIGQLETPIERDLTPEEITAYKALHTNYPTTTIVNDKNANMKVTYLTPSFIPTRETALRMWLKENPII